MTIGPGSVIPLFKVDIRSCFFRGKKPRNKKRLNGHPVIDSAVVNAEAPGKGTTLCPAASAAFTSIAPGSLMPGVPASVTKPISPASSLETTFCSRCGEVC